MAGGILLQSASDAGNGNAFDFRGMGGTYQFSVEPSGTVTSGEVQFEHAPETDYTGTWVPIGSAIAPSTGVWQAFSTTGKFFAVRGRISTAIGGGGTVKVRVGPPLVGLYD